MENLSNVFYKKNFFDYKILSIEGNGVSLWTITIITLLIIIRVLTVSSLAKLLENKILARK